MPGAGVLRLLLHAPVDGYASVLKPVFCGLFDPSERRNAEREFADMIRYAEKKNAAAIGGMLSDSVGTG